MPWRMRGIATRASLIIASVAAGLLIGESLVRIFSPWLTEFPFSENVQGISSLRPSFQGRMVIPHTLDFTATTNSERFRGTKEYTPTPAPNTMRIAILGDSFTWGWGANDDEAYPAGLERILLNATGTTRVQVINAGVPGTGTGEEALYYSTWISQFHPRLVILTVNGTDVADDLARQLFYIDKNGKTVPRPLADIAAADSTINAVRRLVTQFPLYTFLAQHSQLFKLFKGDVGNLLRQQRIAKLSGTTDRRPDTYQGEDFRNVGLRLMAGEILWLNDQVHGHGGRLAIAYFPERAMIFTPQGTAENESRSDDYEIAQFLAKSCHNLNVPYFDGTAAFVTQARQRPDEALFYTGLDTHPTPAGYQTFAEAMATFLEQQGLIVPPATMLADQN